MSTVLVVDDDSDLRELLVMKLTASGYDVVSAADGQGGLDAVASTVPDAVILDWMMPNKNGMDVLQALRDHPRTVRTAIIMMTARARGWEQEQALALGADDYIVKPYSPRLLPGRVELAMAARLRLTQQPAERRSKLRRPVTVYR
jgi:two-component system phosphate regulon response regulator PhoB